jgi:hypothetical protein
MSRALDIACRRSARRFAASACLVLAITACGGGGADGGSSSSGTISVPTTPTQVPTTASVQIVPSLGRITDADVELRCAAGTPVAVTNGRIGADGTVSANVPDCAGGPILISVKGNPQARYFDEAANATLPFAAPAQVRAVVPSTRTTAAIGVTAFTEAAAARFLRRAPIDRTDANAHADNRDVYFGVLAAFGGPADILLAPELIFDERPSGSVPDTVAGRYAIALVALANMGLGAPSATPVLEEMKWLAAAYVQGSAADLATASAALIRTHRRATRLLAGEPVTAAGATLATRQIRGGPLEILRASAGVYPARIGVSMLAQSMHASLVDGMEANVVIGTNGDIAIGSVLLPYDRWDARVTAVTNDTIEQSGDTAASSAEFRPGDTTVSLTVLLDPFGTYSETLALVFREGELRHLSWISTVPSQPHRATSIVRRGSFDPARLPDEASRDAQAALATFIGSYTVREHGTAGPDMALVVAPSGIAFGALTPFQVAESSWYRWSTSTTPISAGSALALARATGLAADGSAAAGSYTHSIELAVNRAGPSFPTGDQYLFTFAESTGGSLTMRRTFVGTRN